MADVKLKDLSSTPLPVDSTALVWVSRDTTGGGVYASESVEVKHITNPGWVVKGDTYQTINGDRIEVDNSLAITTQFLPVSPSTGDIVFWRQIVDQPFFDNPLVIDPGSESVMGKPDGESVIVKTSDIQFSMEFDGTFWVVYMISAIGRNF